MHYGNIGVTNTYNLWEKYITVLMAPNISLRVGDIVQIKGDRKNNGEWKLVTTDQYQRLW